MLLDIAFSDSDPKHGFLTGTKQTLLETKDAGKTWEPRFIEAVDEEGINYRYTSISFNGDEGWLVGKPGAHSWMPRCTCSLRNERPQLLPRAGHSPGRMQA